MNTSLLTKRLFYCKFVYHTPSTSLINAMSNMMQDKNATSEMAVNIINSIIKSFECNRTPDFFNEIWLSIHKFATTIISEFMIYTMHEVCFLFCFLIKYYVLSI